MRSPHSPETAMRWKIQRDELLAALKDLVCLLGVMERNDYDEYGCTATFEESESDEAKKARALIERIEKG